MGEKIEHREPKRELQKSGFTALAWENFLKTINAGGTVEKAEVMLEKDMEESRNEPDLDAKVELNMVRFGTKEYYTRIDDYWHEYLQYSRGELQLKHSVLAHDLPKLECGRLNMSASELAEKPAVDGLKELYEKKVNELDFHLHQSTDVKRIFSEKLRQQWEQELLAIKKEWKDLQLEGFNLQKIILKHNIQKLQAICRIINKELKKIPAPEPQKEKLTPES